MLSKEEVEDFMSQADVVSSILTSFVVSSELVLGWVRQFSNYVCWLFCNFPLIPPSLSHVSQHRTTQAHLAFPLNSQVDF